MAGVDYAVAETLNDEVLQLKRADVTLMLLWEEYATRAASGARRPLKYTSFCDKYRDYADRQLRSMRRTHIGGDIASPASCWSASPRTSASPATH